MKKLINKKSLLSFVKFLGTWAVAYIVISLIYSNLPKSMQNAKPKANRKTFKKSTNKDIVIKP